MASATLKQGYSQRIHLHVVEHADEWYCGWMQVACNYINQHGLNQQMACKLQHQTAWSGLDVLANPPSMPLKGFNDTCIITLNAAAAPTLAAQVLVVTTGSQAEPRAQLSLASRQASHHLTISNSDLVCYSAKVSQRRHCCVVLACHFSCSTCFDGEWLAIQAEQAPGGMQC